MATPEGKRLKGLVRRRQTLVETRQQEDNRLQTPGHGKPHITKRGRSELRRCLYLPTVTASRYNPLVKTLYERLKAHGRNGKSAVVAGMRKLLMLAYSVLTTRQSFAADWPASAKAAEA